MKDVHVAFAGITIALNVIAALWGVWCWWRSSPSVWFWRVLRLAQVSLVVQAALGFVLAATTTHKSDTLHLIYGVLPIAMSFIGEQFRISSAQAVLDARGFESAQAVGELPEDQQRAVALAIVKREIGVMTLAAIVIVVLLARAATTAP
ncbi:MAG: hypothetical protein ACLP0J_26225 [Solirubrobacteraceae bacterium]